MKELVMIESIQIHLTNKCNRRCGHCLFKSSLVKLTELSVTEWVNFFDVNKDFISSTCVVNFFGGEPFLYEGLFELIKHLRERNLSIGVTTNGTQSKKILQRTLDIGVKRFTFDVLHYKETEHDKLKPNTFRKTQAAILFLSDKNVDVHINVIIHKGNSNEIENILNFINTYSVSNISFYSLTEIGSAKHSSFEMTGANEWLETKLRIQKWIDINRPKFSIVWENSYIHSLRQENYRLCCDKVNKNIDIRCDGSVYMCCLLMAQSLSNNDSNSLLLGNIKNNSLSQIINKKNSLLIDSGDVCPVLDKLQISSDKKKNFWCPYDWEMLKTQSAGKIGYARRN